VFFAVVAGMFKESPEDHESPPQANKAEKVVVVDW
jgi:hypothetical protein